MEECILDCVELIFLIVGHTQNLLDQWFSVLSKAIRASCFVGSALAMHELYTLVHNEEKNKHKARNVS